MKKIVTIFLLQFIVFQLQVIRGQSIKEIMLSNGVIYTKTDTIKCFIPMDDLLQLVVRYKTRKEDRIFQTNFLSTKYGTRVSSFDDTISTDGILYFRQPANL